MNKNLKNKLLNFALAFLFALSCFGIPAGIFKLGKQSLASNTFQTPESSYYHQLNAKAKKFYEAISEMNTNGDLKKGNKNFDLVQANIVSAAEVENYGNGNKQLLVDFAAAKDAFALDHPEVFYVDFDLFSISMGTKNSTIFAEIGTGRTDTYYAQDFSSETQVNEIITAIGTEFSALDLSSLQTIKDKVAAINTFVLAGTTYGFENPSMPSTKNHIRSIYGFATYGLSVCEGYAKTFKFLCDNANIECKEVVGYVIDDKTGNPEPHAWNIVKMENGVWYAVDCTFNDEDSIQDTKYLAVGSETLSKTHYESGKVSDNTFEFSYPTIATFDYGKEKLTTNVKYIKDEENNANFAVQVSYNGKNAKELKQNGLYVAIVYGSSTDLDGRTPFVPNDIETFVKHFDTYSEFYLEDYEYIQFLLADYAPDGLPVENLCTYYSSAISSPEAKSNVLRNEYYQVAATPAIASSVKFETNKTTYHANVILPAEQTYTVTISYDEPLKKINVQNPVTIEIESLNFNDLSEFAEISNIEFVGENTITFTFTPSQNYKHHYASYGFKIKNIVTERNNAAPQVAYASFKRKEVVCSKALSGNRLYMSVYAEPSLITDSDLSLSGWTYKENGLNKGVVDGQRSQMALVVSKPQASTQTAVDSKLNSLEPEKLASETYELNLSLCSGLASIPNGSFVKVAFGFPEGYTYNSLDDGVTFKVYHFKKDGSGNIDYNNAIEMDAVITPNGIVVQTSNFSPFAVVATKAEETTKKSVYANALNGFGKIVSTNGNAIESISSASVEFAITPNTGFAVDYVLLNGKDISSRVENGKIRLTHAELSANNTLDVAFAKQSVLENETAEGIENFNKKFAQNQMAYEASLANANTAPENKPTNVLWIVLPIVAVIIVAGVVSAVLIIKKKKA